MRCNTMQGEIVGSHIKATESTTLAKLSMFDQLKLLVSKFNNGDVAELDAAEKLSTVALKTKASLMSLFSKAVVSLENGEHESVTLSVSSKYIPYLDDVIDKNRGMGRYYDFEVHKQDLPINVNYMFIVKIKRKVT